MAAYIYAVRNLKGPQTGIDSTLWQLAYLLKDGIDLSNTSAAELYSMIASGALPGADSVAYWTITNGKTSKEASDMLDERIKQIQDKLAKVAMAEDLRPAPNAMTPYLISLQRFRVH